MKKLVIALLLSFTLLVGCGGTKAPACADCLKQADYEQKFYDQFMEIQTVTTELNTGGDLKAVLKKADTIIDKTVDLKGPIELEAKEKVIDASLADYKKMLNSVNDIASGKLSYSDYMTQVTDWGTKFQKALEDYGFKNVKMS
ncbi:MAG: hypothetical protein LBT75_05150 [Bacilli bacterium]|jgi:hypothetical protein|nr:hypothetical protein [Bacilli bacterium]